MPRRRQKISIPKVPDTSRLVDAAGLRYMIATRPDLEYLTDQEMGDKFGLSAGFVGMVRSGTRAPSQAFLEAVGWEAVTLYRMQLNATPATPVSE